MNTLKNTITLILLTSSLTYSQLPDSWIWMNPKPQGNSLIALDFVNDNTGFVGSFETLYKTTDGGENWNPLPFNKNWYISTIDFINDSEFGDEDMEGTSIKR